MGAFLSRLAVERARLTARQQSRIKSMYLQHVRSAQVGCGSRGLKSWPGALYKSWARVPASEVRDFHLKEERT